MRNEEKRSIIFRADASDSIGLGHAMRCFALAQHLSDRGWECSFVSRQPPEILVRMWAEQGFRIQRYDCEPGSIGDADQLARLVQEHGACWVVLDGYNFGGDFQRRLHGNTRVAVIDDLARGVFYADLIINQTLGALGTFNYECPTGARMLLGEDYILLRREFRRGEPPRAAADLPPSKILVTLGGGDYRSEASVIVEAICRMVPHRLALRVVGHLEGEASSRVGEHEIQALGQVDDMSQQMRWCDVAVTASGSTVWELASMGVPMVLFSLAENQARIASSVAERGGAIDAGFFRRGSETRIADALSSLLLDPSKLRGMTEQARTICDGRGVERVYEALSAGRGQKD